MRTFMAALNRLLSKINWLFVFTVVLPTSLAVAYYGFIASDIYISESRFVVRSPQKQQSNGLLGSIMQEAGFSRAVEDTYTVHDYILSRDAMYRLNDILKIKDAYSKSSIDFINRFPTLLMKDSFEDFHEYYQKYIKVDSDVKTSISVLRVSAFSAQEARRINELLLTMSEGLINKLNERARNDLIQFASVEVKIAEQNARNASLALSNYRSKQSVFDPEKQSALQLQQIAKLQDELIAVKTQLSQVKAFTPDNPQLPMLQKRVESLNKEIATESAKVTSASEGSLSSKASAYERLVLERAFADKQLATAMAALENARNEAQRQQLYLERLAQPNLPDIAVEPKRIKGVFATLMLGLIAMGVLSMFLAGVREHQD